MEKEDILDFIAEFDGKILELKEREITLLAKAVNLMKKGKTEEGANLLCFDNVSVILNELFEVSQKFSKELFEKVIKN